MTQIPLIRHLKAIQRLCYNNCVDVLWQHHHYNIQLIARQLPQDIIVDIQKIQVEAVRELTESLPLNDFGLPIGIYRVDLLPFHDYHLPGERGIYAKDIKTNGKEQEADLVLQDDSQAVLVPTPETQSSGSTESTEIVQKIPRTCGFPSGQLENAFVTLHYQEGYPAQADGRPFWGRLDHEPAEAFAAFEKYLQMNSGAKKPTLSDVEENGIALQDDGTREQVARGGSRSTSLLAAEMFSDEQLINAVEKYREYFHLYYWALRAKSFDLFRVAQHRKAQEIRAIETNDEQYILSRRLMTRLETYLDDDEEFWDMMTPKVGIDLLKQVTAMQRVSAGMPGAAPPSETKGGDQQGGKGLELIYRQVAQQDNPTVTGGAVVSEDGELLDDVLADPEQAAVLQELIIKVNQ